MAFDFPNAPTLGQVATTPAGATFTWDGTKWVSGGATTVSIAAGTGITATPNPITGSGTLALSTPVSVANGGTGATTGAAGPYLPMAGGATSGAIAVQPASGDAIFALRKAAESGNNMIWGQVGTTDRWIMYLGDPTNSNFVINAYNNAGTFVATVLSFARLTGAAIFQAAPSGPTIDVRATSAGNVSLRITSAKVWDLISGSSGDFLVYNISDGASRIIVQPGGNCYNQTGTWNALSDARLKRDVVDYTRGLEAVLRLRPVEFAFNGEGGTVDDGQRHIGLIAQEVEAVVPEVVGSRSVVMRDAEGQPTSEAGPEFMTLDPGRLIYSLINAVKELAARVEVLEGAAGAAG